MKRAIVLALVVACRQVVGIGDEPIADGEVATCSAIAFRDTECARCMVTSCCAEGGACVAASGCAVFYDCVRACGDDAACAGACRVRHPDGDGEAALRLRSCEASRCEHVCGSRCGGYVYPDEPCATCASEHCCEPASTCMKDADCAGLVACERACAARPACLLECELSRPSAAEAARAFGGCLRSACTTTCIGPKWSCLQKPHPPPVAVGPPITVTYVFYDFETARPIPGLLVKGCNKTDLLCKQPLVEGVSGEDGQVALSFSTNFFDGYAEISAADYGPYLLYLPPLAKDFVVLRPLVSISTFSLFGSAIAPLDPERGHLSISAEDCLGAQSGGVQFEIDPVDGTTPFYFKARTPSPSATSTDEDGYGAGGFVNVRANAGITARAKVVENGLGFPPFRPVLVRKSAITLVRMVASPPR